MIRKCRQADIDFIKGFSDLSCRNAEKKTLYEGNACRAYEVQTHQNVPKLFVPRSTTTYFAWIRPLNQKESYTSPELKASKRAI